MGARAEDPLLSLQEVAGAAPVLVLPPSRDCLRMVGPEEPGNYNAFNAVERRTGPGASIDLKRDFDGLANLPERCVNPLLNYMPAIASSATDEWARNFALSMMRQARRPRWRPTPKQESMMRCMVAELFATSDRAGVLED
jgi:hypothetical protein